ncbi:c-type cytochrome [Dyadobacter flavalbus]|nr:cytochrome c [Dyadobacter flavalbus]
MIKQAAAFMALCVLASCQNAEELKSEQYFVEGYHLYTANCSNCHQPDGKGMSNLYPPLAGSKKLADRSGIACIIRNGMKGTILVNGKEFNRPMPANAKLTEIEIAEIVSYVSMKWGKDSLYTPITYVQNALQNCKPD